MDFALSLFPTPGPFPGVLFIDDIDNRVIITYQILRIVIANFEVRHRNICALGITSLHHRHGIHWCPHGVLRGQHNSDCDFSARYSLS